MMNSAASDVPIDPEDAAHISAAYIEGRDEEGIMMALLAYRRAGSPYGENIEAALRWFYDQFGIPQQIATVEQTVQWFRTQYQADNIKMIGENEARNMS